MIKLKVTNIKELQKRFKNAPRKLERLMQKGVIKAGILARDETKRVINTGRGIKKRAVMTGKMRDGIFVRNTGLKSSVKWSSSTPYATYVYEGRGPHRSIGPRPFFKVVEEREGDNIKDIFEKTLEIKKLI